MAADDLFERKAFEDLKDECLQVERKEYTAYSYRVPIAGVIFDAEDLLDTLHEVEGNDIEITYDREKIDVLKRLGIIEHEGNRRWLTGAAAGPNYREFIEMLSEKIEEKRPERSRGIVDDTE